MKPSLRQSGSPKIMVVAGEQSGDELGAGFIREILAVYPDAQIVGVGGSAMADAGCELWESADRLAVMGLWEVVQHLPQLERLRRDLYKRACRWRPDIFVGIDAPDFNLPLAHKLKRVGIKTVHYVSPSVWAWRKSRIHRIRDSVDLMLTLFPFESQIYEQHHVPFQCVGHPLVDQLKGAPAQQQSRQDLGFPSDAPLLAILPGSRASEVARIAPIFIQAAQQLREQIPNLEVVLAAASSVRATELAAIVARQGMTHVSIKTRQTTAVLSASDVVLVASGTATLETALLHKPMVVGYRLSPLTYWLGRWLVQLRWFALPNILLGQKVVPELIQNDLTATQVAREAMTFLQDPKAYADCQTLLAQVPEFLGYGVDRKVAQAILKIGGFSDV